MFRRASLLAFFLSGSFAVCDALEWKTKSLEFNATPFQSTQEATFHFTNTGDRPVRILAVESNCDCLDALADQLTYAPGATGIIRTTFSIGERIGEYERRIKVTTDENKEPVRLLLRVDVPELVAVTPQSVAWTLRAAANERSIDLTVIPSLVITFTEVKSTNTDFSARLETIEAGRHYRIHVKPPNTAQPANTAFRLRGRASSGQEVVVSAYGNVR